MLEKIYYIKDNRLYFKYKRYKNKSINVKIPFKGEVYPILKYIHINNNHIGYKNMCNQILLSEFYWLGYSQDITNFLNKWEICLSNKKKKHILSPLKIIIDEGPKFRYIVDLWEIPEDLSLNTDYIYILDCIDHFSKFLNSFLLKNKTMVLLYPKLKYFVIIMVIAVSYNLITVKNLIMLKCDYSVRIIILNILNLHHIIPKQMEV